MMRKSLKRAKGGDRNMSKMTDIVGKKWEEKEEIAVKSHLI